MPSDTLSRVVAFEIKANELCNKGHMLRASENYGRAAEAARALGEDNLVVVNMKLQQGNLLFVHAMALLEPQQADTPVDLRVLAAQRAECIALVSDALDSLERRRVADTLKEGKCAAAEEAWYGGMIQRANPNMTAAVVAFLADGVGYSEFLHAATVPWQYFLNPPPSLAQTQWRAC